MRKIAKSAAELEKMLQTEVEVVCAWPVDLLMAVEPDGDTWTVEIVGVRTPSHEDLREIARMIADIFKCEYDLVR